MRRIRAMLDPVSRRAGVVLLAMSGGYLGRRGVVERFERRRAEVDEMIYEEIALRRDAPDLEQRDDVFSMLVLARDEDGQPMSDRELRDELVTLLVAGHETTATGLAWAFDLLLHNPRVLAKLQEGGDDYLDAVVKESLRIRPVIPGIGRVVQKEPFALDGYKIPVGIEINPSIAGCTAAQLSPAPGVPPRAFPRAGPARHLHVDPVRRRGASLPRRELRAHGDAHRGATRARAHAARARRRARQGRAPRHHDGPQARRARRPAAAAELEPKRLGDPLLDRAVRQRRAPLRARADGGQGAAAAARLDARGVEHHRSVLPGRPARGLRVQPRDEHAPVAASAVRPAGWADRGGGNRAARDDRRGRTSAGHELPRRLG